MNLFKIDWVLINKLAIGTAPLNRNHLNILKKHKIVSILSLTDEHESPYIDGLDTLFNYKRIILPDHKTGRDPTIPEINIALKALKDCLKKGPTYIHCFASMERSPLVCIAWLINEENLNLEQAHDYIKQIHPETNPLNSQLKVLHLLNQT